MKNTLLAIMFFLMFAVNQRISDYAFRDEEYTKDKNIEEKIEDNKPIQTEYIRKIQKKIRENWNPPAGKNSAKVKVLFRLNRKGELVSTKIVSNTGSKKLAKECIRTIRDSAPFSPVPNGLSGEFISVEFTFSYNVLNKK